jgi:hypothetical protein
MQTLLHKLWKRLGALRTTLAITGIAIISSVVLLTGVHLVIGGVTFRGLLFAIFIPCVLTPVISYFFLAVVRQLETAKAALVESEKNIDLSTTISPILFGPSIWILLPPM